MKATKNTTTSIEVEGQTVIATALPTEAEIAEAAAEKKAERKEKKIAQKKARTEALEIVKKFAELSENDEFKDAVKLLTSSGRKVAVKREPGAYLLLKGIFEKAKSTPTPNQMHEDEIWKRARIGRREMREAIARAMKLPAPYNLVVSFDEEMGTYRLDRTDN